MPRSLPLPTSSQSADQGDVAALAILSTAAAELAAMVAAVARKLDLSANPFPLALAGGVLLASEKLRNSLRQRLGSLDLRAASMTEVRDPVLGALRLAQHRA